MNDMSRHISLNKSVAHSKYSDYYAELDVMGNMYEDYGPLQLKLSGGLTLAGSHYNAINEAGGGELGLHISDYNYVRIAPKLQTSISSGSFEYGPLTISPSVVLGAEVDLNGRKASTRDSHFLSFPELSLPIPLNHPGRRGYRFGFEGMIKHVGYRDRFNISFVHEKRDRHNVNSLRLYHMVRF